MTTAKDRPDILPPDSIAPPEGIEVRPSVWFHPWSPDASLEQLRELAGSIKLTKPLTLRELQRSSMMRNTRLTKMNLSTAWLAL